MPALLILVVGLFGACLGSFLNVVLWRVPRGESLVSPGSHCPSCDTPLGAVELVPVLSWVGLRGRCRHCGARISARYPLVELGCGLAFAAVAWLLVS
jgi:leader peptidase (prepilin peptidase)/N-methyltransferase